MYHCILVRDDIFYSPSFYILHNIKYCVVKPLLFYLKPVSVRQSLIFEELVGGLPINCTKNPIGQCELTGFRSKISNEHKLFGTAVISVLSTHIKSAEMSFPCVIFYDLYEMAEETALQNDISVVFMFVYGI